MAIRSLDNIFYQRVASAALAALLAPGIAIAAPAKNLSQLNEPAWAFAAADTNADSQLSRSEYRNLRSNIVGDSWVRSYRGDAMATLEGGIDRSFAQVDRDNSGMISLEEFWNVVVLGKSKSSPNATADRQNTSARSSNAPDWSGWEPNYVTMSYYLAGTPVDTDTLKGKDVMNLVGDKVGTLNRIIRADETDRHYAMIDIRGTPMYRAGRLPRDEAGVPLEDMLIAQQGSALMLSTRGEEYLREADARVVKDFEEVERLYRN